MAQDAAEFNTVIDAEDHTGNILPEDQRAQPSEAQQEGIDTAKANAKREAKENTSQPDNTLTAADENIANARETAELNAKADGESQPENQYKIAKNDTTKAGKVRATKAQLDPAGDDPITQAEIERAATDGVNAGKVGTSVSNEEAAERAQNPGRAEEQSDHSIAGDGVAKGSLEATDAATHTNKNETRTTGEGGIANELAGPQNQSGPNADPSKTDNSADKN